MLGAFDLSFGYGSDPLLNRWNARFAPGEVTAITGPSGRGKSTVLYLLGLMLRPQEGSVVFRGVDVGDLSDRERSWLRASAYGFVFQDAALDPTRTVLDNVVETALYRGEDPDSMKSRAGELLERFGVSLRAGAKPGQVSGGQAQRIALCRALLGMPTVILADEPTGNLDSESADLVIETFHQEARRGATVVVVTHDARVAERCHRRIEL